MKPANLKRSRPTRARLILPQGWITTGLALLSLFWASNLFATVNVKTLTGGWWQYNTKTFYGNVDGNTFSVAQFDFPSGLALDPMGTLLFVADYTNNAVRLITLTGSTATSQTTTFANTYNGISRPVAVAVDGATNVYVLNRGNGNNGTVLQFNGLYAAYDVPPIFIATNAAGLTNATALALDGLTNIYVTIRSNTVIRITPSGTVSTVGIITNTGTSLRGITVLDDGNLALSDAGNHGIWVLNPVSGLASKLTGFHGAGDTNGPAAFAAFNHPENIAKAGGGMLVVADRYNHKVKLVDASGTVTRLYGVSSNLWVPGPSTLQDPIFPGWWDGNVDPVEEMGSVEAREPLGAIVAPDGSVYTTEVYYHIIRHVTGTGLTGPQPGYLPLFNGPMGIALDNAGDNLFIADQANNAVQVLNFNDNLTTTYLTAADGISHPASVLLDTNDYYLYVLNQNAGANGNILSFDPYGNPPETIATGLNNPTAFTMDANGNIFVSEQSGAVRVVYPSGVIGTVATVTNANVSLQGIALFDDGDIAVSDAGNHVIWTVNSITKTNFVTKLTGQLGTNGTTLGFSNQAKLYQPHQLARAGGNQLLIADTGNSRLVVVNRSGSITNVLNSTNSYVWFGRDGDPFGPNSSRWVSMMWPIGVAVSGNGIVYASETYYEDIRGLTGTLTPPSPAPIVTLPYFNNPEGIAVDSSGANLYIADTANNVVERLNFGNNQTTVYLTSTNGVNRPVSVLLDTTNNLYVLNQADGTNGSIISFDPYGCNCPLGTNVIGLTNPTAFTMDADKNIFVTEQSSNISVVYPSGVKKTLATITNANVSLQGIALFDDGTIAVSDVSNHVIWVYNAITETISILTGQLGSSGTTIGPAFCAKLFQPHQLARAGGNQLVIADTGNNRLVTVTRDGTITTALNSTNSSVWFGQNGDPVEANSARWVSMVSPVGVAVSVNGIVYASETYYEDIRGLIDSGLTSSSNPRVPLPFYSYPTGVALNYTNTILFVADPTNDTISTLNLINNQTAVFLNSSNGIYQPVDVALDSSDNLYVLNQGTGGNGSILKFDKYGNLLGTNASSLSMPTAMRLSFAGDLYVAELNGAVQKFYAGGSNATLVTITTNANVRLSGIALLDDGSVVVSDAGNHVLWKIASSATNAVLFTGVFNSSGANFGAVGNAKLNTPLRLAQAYGGGLLIVDSGNNRVVVCDDLGTISSALNSSNAMLWFGNLSDPVTTNSPNFVPMLAPVGLAIGNAGTVFVSETTYKDIRGILDTGIQAPIAPPDAPRNLAATATYGQVTLTWSASIGATNYNVKRSPSTGGPYSLIGSTTGTSYTDTTVINGTTYYYVVSAVNAGGEGFDSSEVSVTVPLPPVATPEIGYVDFPATSLPVAYTAVFHSGTSFVFNNDVPIVIVAGESGSQLYYTYGAYGTTIPDPTTNSLSAPAGYADGMTEAQVAIYSINPSLPNVVIKAIGAKNDGSPNSAIAQAWFQFVTANPNITGDNAAQFTISDVTANAHLYYTIDGSIPSATNGVDLGTVATPTNVWTVGFTITSNTVFNVVAVRPHYQDSAVVSVTFSPTNFTANTISFGFAAGEASSDFIGSPGQTFYAPVTLSILDSVMMYSLQFNLTVTNAGINPGPAVGAGLYSFSSMLMKPIPGVKPVIYEPIPPAMFVDGSTVNPNPITVDGSSNFASLLLTNSSLNLLGVGWVERAGATNLYDTTKQDLIQYSMAHDTLFDQSGLKIIVGGYAFRIPGSATNGQTYQIQIGRPSATSDGIGAPGSDVYIAAPTNGSTAGGSPVSALKYVTVGQRKYIAGDVYPFRWFNAGDFGKGSILNADVEQVFQSAIYGLNRPQAGSDFFDAMDSCGATYIDLGHGYLELNTAVNTNLLNVLFDGDDTTINQIAFGDGKLDVCDVYVTFRRSLDPSLTNFFRFWTNGVRAAQFAPNNFRSDTNSDQLAEIQTATRKSLVSSASTSSPSVIFMAGDALASAGQTLQIPVTAQVLGNYPLRVLMLNLTIEPLDGSPPLTEAVQFTPVAALGSPTSGFADSQGTGNYAAAWLDSGISGISGSNALLGTLTVTIPTNAAANAAYAIHFDHVSGSPNGIASFPRKTMTGLITLSDRSSSSFNDGIPDSWRLRYFGTVNNLLSQASADADGDGMSNWEEYKAGTDPTDSSSNFKLKNSKNGVTSASVIRWPSVAGRNYVVEIAPTLYSPSWIPVSTNTGTGWDIEYDDLTGGGIRFYRVRVLP